MRPAEVAAQIPSRRTIRASDDGQKAVLCRRLWWWKGPKNGSRIHREVSQATRPHPDGANCRLTAHMNAPESAVGLVHSRQSAPLRQSQAYNLNLWSSWQRQLLVWLYTWVAALPGTRCTLRTASLSPADRTLSSVTNHFAVITRSVDRSETRNKGGVRWKGAHFPSPPFMALQTWSNMTLKSPFWGWEQQVFILAVWGNDTSTSQQIWKRLRVTIGCSLPKGPVCKFSLIYDFYIGESFTYRP